jgi:DNA topoisomerase-2
MDSNSDNISAIYKSRELREHIQKNPHIFVGDMYQICEKMYVYDDAAHKIYERNVTFIPGLLKLFDEILVNALDHRVRIHEIIEEQKLIKDKKKPENVKIIADKVYNYVKEIRVDITETNIIVMNDGDGIDVCIHPESKKYVPEMIFGTLLAGSNYDGGQTVGGMNGLGTKLCAILGKLFIVETVDAYRGLKYIQHIHDNMTRIDPPVIISTKEKPYTKFTFVPDYAMFKIPKLINEVTSDLGTGITAGIKDETYLLMLKRTIDIIGINDIRQHTQPLNVYLNGKKVSDKSNNTFETYINLYIGKKSETKRIYKKLNDFWEIVVCKSSDNTFDHISFVNGINTYRGGKHVDHIKTLLSKQMVKYMTENGKKNVPSEKNIIDNMMIFINTIMIDPVFDTQSKEKLTLPLTKFHSRCDNAITQDFIMSLCESKMGIIDAAQKTMKFKNEKDLAATTEQHVAGIHCDLNNPNPKSLYNKAFYAGTKNRSKCILIICEGKSAKGSILKALGAMDKEVGNYYGILPVKGKMINPKNVKVSSVSDNVEFNELKYVLNLHHDIDYTHDGNFNKLHYGKVMVFTDADTDGDHIKGLCMNIFHTYWPSLLKRNYLCSFLTPTVIITFKGKKIIKKFFSFLEFNDWKHKNIKLKNTYTLQYYKGLGSSSAEEVKKWFKKNENKIQCYTWTNTKNTMMTPGKSRLDDLLYQVILHLRNELPHETDNVTSTNDVKNPINNGFIIKAIKENIYDAYKNHSPTDLSFHLLFNDKYADHRKTLILDYLKSTTDHELNNKENLNADDFLLKKLIQFSYEDCCRSIPNIMDGLKPVQRKILFTCIDLNLTKVVSNVDIVGRTIDKTAYHNGNTSIEMTMVGLAQNFTGSNNVNLLLPDGQYGSRELNGDDAAAARYLHTALMNYTLKLYHRDDEYLYSYMDNDSKPIEPFYYAPILPMVLVNGTEGIGTGWSTYIPCHNIYSIITYIENILLSQPQTVVELPPYFNGYAGIIYRENKINNAYTVHKSTISGRSNLSSNSKLTAENSYIIEGCFERKNEVTIEISEIPVGTKNSMCYSDYFHYLKSLITRDHLSTGNLYILENVADKKTLVKKYLKDMTIQIMPEDRRLFTIIFLSKAQLDGLLKDLPQFKKIFKLSMTISINNMHLFDENGIIKKYITPLQIIDDYFKIRIGLYQSRITYMIDKLTFESNVLSEQYRFISYLIDDAHPFKIAKLSNEKLQQMFERFNFQKIKNVNLVQTKKLRNKLLEINELCTSDDSPNLTNNESSNLTNNESSNLTNNELSNYRYLLSMHIQSFTESKLLTLQISIDKVTKELDYYNKEKPQNLWYTDIQEFKKVYANTNTNTVPGKFIIKIKSDYETE